MKKSLKTYLWSLSLVALVPLVACSQNNIKGSGNVTQQAHDVGAFTSIDVGGAFDVVLEKGNSPKVIIETDDNIHEAIKVEVKGGELNIGTRSGWNMQKTSKLKAYITYTSLEAIEVSGASNLKSNGTVESSELELELSGAGKITMDIKVKKLSVDISGAGSLEISGSADFQRLDLSGAASYSAYQLMSKESVIHVSGAGSAKVNVANSLEAHASGAASIKYKGSPQTKDFHKSGAASIEKTD